MLLLIDYLILTFSKVWIFEWSFERHIIIRCIEFTDSVWRGVKCDSCTVAAPITLNYALAWIDFLRSRSSRVRLLLFDNVAKADLFPRFELPRALRELVLFECRLQLNIFFDQHFLFVFELLDFFFVSQDCCYLISSALKHIVVGLELVY